MPTKHLFVNRHRKRPSQGQIWPWLGSWFGCWRTKNFVSSVIVLFVCCSFYFSEQKFKFHHTGINRSNSSFQKYQKLSVMSNMMYQQGIDKHLRNDQTNRCHNITHFFLKLTTCASNINMLTIYFGYFLQSAFRRREERRLQ